MFPACNECNLTLKIPNRKKVTQGQGTNKKPMFDGEMEWTIIRKTFFPVVFHNVKSYYAYFVIKHFKKQYTARSREQDDDDIEGVGGLR